MHKRPLSMTLAGLAGALFLAGTAWAGQPTAVPRTGGIPACEAALDEANTNLAACTENLTTCEDGLSTCEDSQAVFPGDGVTGAPLAYEACADGLTVADLNTGLLWERKVPGGSGPATCLTALHGVSSTCTWEDATGAWIDAVNAEGGTGYDGFSDWRVPNIKELLSIVDYGAFWPAIDPSFPGETASSYYWSETLLAGDPALAWDVDFSIGFAPGDLRFFNNHVRAVRTGSCRPPPGLDPPGRPELVE